METPPGKFDLSTIYTEPIICQNAVMLENTKSLSLDIKCCQIAGVGGAVMNAHT